ncbi:MFS transporter [Bradyrhizobium embrapense]|uniref:MFS transporter n=1 Tax=Bradyrhizobium embrapense TaxID=630921 RepID=UPI003D31A8AD
MLSFCFLIGCGAALRSPAWQASVSEQVPLEALPAAVALDGISYNVARSVGPAVGGAIVALGGASAAYALSALLYIPLFVVLVSWDQ